MKHQLTKFLGRNMEEVERRMVEMSRTFLDFDRVFERFDRAFPVNLRTVTYPPVDLRKVEGGYVIDVAVAGFQRDDITVEVDQDNVLTITGKADTATTTGEYLFKGIAARSFIRKWQLLETDKVTSAEMKDGMLTIAIQRETPVDVPPTRIEIK